VRRSDPEQFRRRDLVLAGEPAPGAGEKHTSEISQSRDFSPIM